ncbi:hypothetical protein PPS11_11936 [Pseudomonas putida S11]|nr:hypothetical protein PPS11_11936 [Pseudomonas putida S11]
MPAGTPWPPPPRVSNEKDNSLSLIDMQTLQVTETLPVGQRPRGLLLSHDNTLLYICASDSDRVQVMDVATRKIIKELPSGKDPEQFALHPNDRWLYVSNEDDALVTVIDTQTDKVLGQIDVGIEPEGMAVSPDGKWAVNTSETTNMLHWIDTSTQTLADSTPGGPAAALRRVQPGRLAAVGLGRDRRHGDHPRRGQPPDAENPELPDQGRAPGQGPAGRHQAQRRWQVRVRRPGPGQPCGGCRCQDL